MSRNKKTKIKKEDFERASALLADIFVALINDMNKANEK